jgi:hypothetical protein
MPEWLIIGTPSGFHHPKPVLEAVIAGARARLQGDKVPAIKYRGRGAKPVLNSAISCGGY